MTLLQYSRQKSKKNFNLGKLLLFVYKAKNYVIYCTICHFISPYVILNSDVIKHHGLLVCLNYPGKRSRKRAVHQETFFKVTTTAGGGVMLLVGIRQNLSRCFISNILWANSASVAPFDEKNNRWHFCWWSSVVIAEVFVSTFMPFHQVFCLTIMQLSKIHDFICKTLLIWNTKDVSKIIICTTWYIYS